MLFSLLDELDVNVRTLYHEFRGSPMEVLLRMPLCFIRLITYHVMCQLSRKKQQEITRSVPDPSPRGGVGSGNETNCHCAIMIDVQCHHSVAIVVMCDMIELIVDCSLIHPLLEHQ